MKREALEGISKTQRDLQEMLKQQHGVRVSKDTVRRELNAMESCPASSVAEPCSIGAIREAAWPLEDSTESGQLRIGREWCSVVRTGLTWRAAMARKGASGFVRRR